MAPRAGVLTVDVEPNLSQVGPRLDALARGLKPFGVKVDVDNDFAREIEGGARVSRRSLDGITTTKAQGELRELGTVGERELGRIGSSAKFSSQALLTAGAGSVLVGGKILSSLKPATDAASDLNEAVSYSSVVFGASAQDIDQWSETSAKAFGQSKRQAIEGATTFATFGKAAGLAGDDLVGFSTDLVKLASDLASAKNTSPEEAITAIGAALRGESEPIRTYGVLLDEATLRQEALALGLTKTTKEALTPQQKVLAAQAAIFKQTGDAQGDYARTADGAANSARRLTAEIENAKADEGQGLLGLLSATNKAASTVLNTLDEIPGATSALGVALAGVGGTAILGGAASSILGARRALVEYRQEAAAARSASTSVGTAGAAGFGKLGTAVTVAGGVLAAVGIAEGIGAISNSLKNLDIEAKNALDGFVASAEGTRTELLSAFEQLADVADSSTSIGDIINSFGTEFEFAGVTAARDIEYFQKAFDQISTTQPVERVQAFIDAARAQNSQLDQNSENYIETEKLLDAWQETLGVATKAQQVSTKGIDAGSDSLDRFGFKIDETKGKYEQYASSINQAFNVFDGARDALRERLEADREVAEAEAEVNRLRGEGNVDTEEAVRLANDLADAEARVAESKRSVLAAQRDLNDANRDLADLEAELAHVDPTRDPNRYRDLSEKVRDARDAQLDAQDRVASALESARSAEVNLGETRSDQAGGADSLAEAEDRLTQARERQEQAVKNLLIPFGALADALEANPELVASTFDAIDELGTKYGLAADEVERMKKEILFVIAAQQAMAQQAGATSSDLWMDNEHRAGATTRPTIDYSGYVPIPGDGFGYNAGGAYYPFVGSGRLAGGPVAKNSMYPVVEDGRPELLEMGGQTYLMTGGQSGNVISYPRFASDLSGIAAGGGAAFVGTADDPMGAVVDAINALRSDVANLQNITYAPQITAMPRDVGPTMDEAFRAARRNSWETHGRRLTNA